MTSDWLTERKRNRLIERIMSAGDPRLCQLDDATADKKLLKILQFTAIQVMQQLSTNPFLA